MPEMLRRAGRVPLAWPCVGLLAGVLLGDAPVPAWSWAVLGSASLGAVWRLTRRPGLGPAAVALFLLAVSVGALRERSVVAEHARVAAGAGLAPGAVATLRGEVLDRLEERDPQGGRLLRLRWRLRISDPAPGLVTATFREDAPGRPGETVEMTGLFLPPRSASNPGAFDTQAWALREGVLGTLVIGGSEGVRSLGPAPGILASLRSLRERLRLRLSALFPGEQGDLLGALLLGVREPLDEELGDAFLETGTLHYLSISGTHVLVVLGALAWALSWTPLGLKARAAILIAAAVFYACLVGMQAPVLRASLAASLAAAALLAGRPRAALNAVAAAAILIILSDPAQAFLADFQLSFLAAAGILGMASPISAGLEAVVPGVPWPRTRAWMLGALSVSLAAWISVIPLVARQCHLVTPVVLAANLAVFPLVALVMGGGALALLFPAVAPLARGLLEALFWTVKAFAEVPGGHLYVGETPGWVLAAYYAVLAAFLWHLKAGGPAWLSLPRLTAASLALLAGVLAWGMRPSPPGARITMIDVGQGLSVLVQAPGGRALLYDCGAYGNPGAGGRTMAPALWALGVRRLDAVAVSHAHDDHYNGLGALARRFGIGEVLTPRAAIGAMPEGLPVSPVATGDRLDLGGGAFAEVLHPAGDLEALPNDTSLCLRVVLPAGRARLRCWRSQEAREMVLPSGRLAVLLTGDLEDLGAALLLASGSDAASDVLLVPHHGGAMEALGPLLSAVRPSEAWISAREGFPSPATLSALAGSGARLRETWRDGAVILETLP